MNAKEVIDKILAEGRSEAEKIKAEGQQELDAYVRQVDGELADYQSQTDELAKKAAEDKKLRVLAGARMASSKSVLSAKRAAIRKVFDSAAEKITGMNDDEYLGLMGNLIKKTIETGDEAVVIGKNETRINDDFIKQINRELGAGFRGNILLSKDRADINGGFILKRGDISINVSVDVLMQMAREQLETELASELFSE